MLLVPNSAVKYNFVLTARGEQSITMAELESLNPDNSVSSVEYVTKVDLELCIKKEVEVGVKPEPQECVTCSSRGLDGLELIGAATASGAALRDVLFRLTRVDLAANENYSKYMCKNCFELINVLEAAEQEYIKLKQAFDDIISRNPLFEQSTQSIELNTVKTEVFDEVYNSRSRDNDSEDEPLAVTKKKRHRKLEKAKKKTAPKPAPKRKSRLIVNESKESWQCNVCGKRGSSGGSVAEAAHRLTVHSLVEPPSFQNVKTEDSTDGTQTPDYSNGFDTASDSLFKLEMGDFDDDDDDDSDSYIPDDISTSEVTRKRTRILPSKKRKRQEDKVMHQCDQCDVKYSSLVRLQQHKRKHDDSKPPYICEVCGAHYKHKRACDIHVALHKGISDWKCEECNKLFPSKGALHRHNNIHTGKPNYQCDLCGKSFIHTSSFKMHKLSHSGVKPHACDVCGLALMTRSHLKRHKRVHSGEKRHECPICGKRFSERYNLVAHSKSHLAEGTPTSEPAAPATPPPRRRLFRCNFCQERFERRYMLERHVSVVHGRTLERPPPTPRNTMSKMLKAQAQARRSPTSSNETTTKEEPSSESTDKLPAASNPWTNAYVQEFGLRPEYQH